MIRQLKIVEKVTLRTSTIERYFTDVGPVKGLSSEEEVKLANRIRQGDEVALNKLVTANLRFVIAVAKHYSNRPELLTDLISQGNIGLIDAAKTFDPTLGFKFISYAVWHIRKEILQYLNSSIRTVRIPQNLLNDLSKIKKVESHLANELGREPELEELVARLEETGWEGDVKKIELARKATESTVSFEPTNPDEDWAPSSWLESEESTDSLIESEEGKKWVDATLSSLSPIDREVVTLYLGLRDGLPSNFQNIGDRWGKTAEWARQRYVKSMRRLKNLSLKRLNPKPRKNQRLA